MRNQPGINTYHVPVLLSEAINFLNINKGHWYVDATIGGGGHAQEIIKKGGKVIGIDQDADAIKYLKQKYAHLIKQGILILKKNNFTNVDKLVEKKEIYGILFDLGVSTHQLKNKNRGFSFQREDRLDMRMDQQKKISAYDIVNKFTIAKLAEIFRKLGEEQLAWDMAEAIGLFRTKYPIVTTKQLAQIAQMVYQQSGQKTAINPATKIFQALRIYVNNELEALKLALSKALNLLCSNGRLVVISYHSLEDRLTKQNFLQAEKQGGFKILTKSVVVPSDEEIRRNPASRSARLRAILKL